MEIRGRSALASGRISLLLFAVSLLIAATLRAQDTPDSPPETEDRLAGSTVVRPDYVPLAGSERFRLYVRRTFASGSAYYGPLFSATREQASGEPHEWGGGMEGYERRVASKLGTSMIRGSIRASTAAALGEDPRFILKRQGSAAGRAAHALAFTVLTVDRKGRTRPAVSVVGAYVAANLIAQEAWMPDRLTPRDGVREAGRQLLGAALMNQFREFWPEIRKHVFRRK